ncbi:hypothetical protein MPTK1_6g07390 [Marchantia polymorpha subsp. ruderalis]|uniref:Vacuolar protein sorting-associated protein 13 VPS13 adaptor binding domain-containing protein n=2 Tax=Marchantia polymorpha TaxID=3197 RepID=A0AAF6BPH9_MARPO|nr:hypothetical protein MARPO_0053s0053 [Marchantia polymorpha]BBN13913.1 hypothetical protein Mp_6g07390 [Marchantia polymorpha subsp. ruderalis]|eukprot:PTQ38115.1 hypothetical protein MARPO_0053s0053 [Marchantia polymorpha]
MLGLKERAEKYVVKNLRPWLVRDVSPEVQISTSGVTLRLRNLEFDVEALNGAAMQSSPLLIKEAVKVEEMEFIFAPFRMPVLSILVQGLHLVLQPRSTEDDWWEKKREKTAEQEITAALEGLDPQGSSAHAAAETLAGGKTENKLITRFLASLALSCVKFEFRDCSVKVVAYAHDKLQHFCHIPLGSFVFGKEQDSGFASSGGLAVAVAKASSSVWKGNAMITTSSCSIRRLGLQVDAQTTEQVQQQSTPAGREGSETNADAVASETEEIIEDYLSAQSSSENGGMSVVALPELSSRERSKFVVIFEEVDLRFSMQELKVDSLELETQEAAVGLDFEEMTAFQILMGQVKGPAPPLSSEGRQKDEESGSEMKSLDNARSQRSPLELWKRGIQKAVELSSRRRLKSTIRAGVSRRRYSNLYENWLLELGWGQKKDADVEKVRSKKQLDRIDKLSKDLCALQKDLPLEAIALGRRIARRRVTAALHSKDLLERSNSTSITSVQTSKMYSSFQTFLNAVWNWMSIASIAIEGKANGISGSITAAWRLIKNKWRGKPASESEALSDAAAEAQSEASVSSKYSKSDVRDREVQRDVDKYFQLSSDQEEGEIRSSKKKWAMTYAVTIGKGSIVFASGAIGSVRKKGEDGPQSDGGLSIESAFIPALHFTWENLLVAYGSTASATGSSITCGSLQIELLSILPSQLPEELTKGLDDRAFDKDFVSFGRWAANAGDRALLVSSRPCPQKIDRYGHNAHSLPLADGMYAKHWNWQDRLLKVWAECRAPLKDEQASKGRSSGDRRPFFIAEFNSLDDDPITEDCPGSVIKCSLAMGQLDCSLKGSYLSRIRLLLDQLMVSQKRNTSNSVQQKMHHQTNSRTALTLEEFCDELYKVNLVKSREAMVSAVPGKSVLFTAVVDGPKVRLSASANELFDFQNQDEQEADRNVSRYDSSLGATIVVDLGRLEIAMWPPQKLQVESTSSTTVEDSGRFSSRWMQSMENKAWLKKPPVPSVSEDFGEGTYWEHEQVANNLYLSSTGVALDLEMRRETLKKLSMVGPLGFVIETSFCWDQFSSLFSTSKSVCASVNLNIPSLSVQSYINEVSIMLQVLAFYSESLKPNYRPDSTLIIKKVRNSPRFNVFHSEELNPTVETTEEDTGTEGSVDYGEIALSTAFALSFSLQVGNFKMVLGDGRLEDGTSGGASGVRKDEGLRYEPREERLALVDRDVDTFTTWEQKLMGANMGREAYVSFGNFLVESSMGDGVQLYVFSALNNAAVRLVDCSIVSNKRDLNEIRKQFLSDSESDRISAVTLTEVSVANTSVKVFGPNYFELTEVDAESVSLDRSNTGFARAEPHNNEMIGDTEGGDELVSPTTLRDNDLDPNQNSKRELNGVVGLESMETLPSVDQEEAHQQQSPHQVDDSDALVTSEVGTQWLVVSVEVDKVLLTDGSLDVLIAKVAKVATGSDVLHMDLKVDRSFENISLITEGGLVLLHTAAVATLMHFGGDIHELVKKAGILFTSRETKSESYRDDEFDMADEPSWQTSSLSKSFRSSSLPPPTGNKAKKFKRTLSAPPRSRVPLGGSTKSVSPTFGGLVSSQISGFSIVLARHSSTDEVPEEGVLFELEISSLIEVDESAKKASVDLRRFTILGLQARVPGNSQKKPGRLGSRAPQFGSSFRKAGSSGSAGEGTFSSQDLSKKLQRGGSSGLLEETDSGDLELLSRSDIRGMVDEEAQKFGKALSEFNSFILENLSVSCAVERVADTDKVWKWSNAWKGHCSIDGLNVAITTSEIQLVESLVSPLSNLTGSKGSSAAEIATNALLEGTNESPDEYDVDIPDGSIIAIKDVHEHCYLAAEEVGTSKGNFRLVGVLHYTLAGDKALFKVKYQDSSKTTRSKTAWFSLLSLHAKNSEGDPLRVHYRPGSGLVDVSSTNDGSREQWQFLKTESSEEEGEEQGDFDIRNSSSRRVFHLVNQKSKTGIAFEDNVPLLVKQPGNPFKIKVVSKPTQSDTNPEEAKALTQKDETPLQTPPLDDHEAVRLVTSIPHVLCKFETFVLTVLHEAAGGLHLLPLLRVRVPGTEGVIQAGVTKSRTILQCGIVLEYYEMQTTLWVPVINPIETDIFYRARSVKHAVMATNSKKTPVALFTRLRKVEFVVSEPSLDACLFLIGALDLAGPFTMKHSPVQANRCLVENHTGVDLLCRFNQGPSNLSGAAESGKSEGMDQVDGMIAAWHSDSFLMRHMTSRRDTSSAKVASTLELKLQKDGGYMSSTLFVTLGEPGVIATRTRLYDVDGQRSAPGPIVVVDVTRRSQDGIYLTVSPMIRIRNASGLLLELRCRRDKQGEEGAVVQLEDGDVIDDSMGAFDALNLRGELKKALTSLNLGNYLLSIRPTEAIQSADNGDSDVKVTVESNHEWSDDVKGAKLVKAAGLFDKLQYSFQKSMKVRNVDSSFGVVYCALKPRLTGKPSEHIEKKGYHFMIRTTCRKVPISRPKSSKELEQEPRGKYTFVAWQEQQEILLLPTVRVINLLTSSITITLTLIPEGDKRRGDFTGDESLSKATVESGETARFYIQLGDLFLTIKHEGLGLSTKPICLGVGNKEISRKGEILKDLELFLDFGDGIHNALVAVSRGEDGVLEAAVLTRYILHNDSHVPLLCCPSKHKSSRRWGGLRAANELEWPDSGKVTTIAPYSRASWFDRSTKLLVKRTDPEAEPAILDVESLSGSTEISLKVQGQDSVLNRIQLGVHMQLPDAGDTNSSCVIRLVPRYIVANESGEAILVCQDGFQDDAEAMVSLAPGERAALHAQVLPSKEAAQAGGKSEAGPEVLLTVRFRPKETGWNWSGPVCAAALGSFSVKIRRPQSEDFAVQMPRKEELWFAMADVKEEASSLITAFRKQAADAIPYHIENVLRSTSITYSQEGLNESELLQSGASVGYVWDDLGLPHKLTVKVSGTPLSHDVNLDKLRSWKSFRAVRRKKGLLQIPFLNELSNMALYGDDANNNLPSESSLPPVGYEVYADGPTRVLRICEERDSKTDRRWQSNISSPKKEIEIRMPVFTMSIVEPLKQTADTEQGERDSPTPISYVPIITLRLTNVLIEALVPPEYTLCQLKTERLDIDVRWQGAPVAAMLRGHGQDRFSKGHTVFHMAVVMSNLARNPIQLKYASILLQAIDLNLDEDTLMKLAPFYRSSLSDSTAPSRRIYFERFEIHPIKIVGSFLPGNPRADYSSGQETLRGLLHSVIKIPAVRGTTVELNGVLLSHALLTFKQLALKCAQHYSWYSMRAIYIARGSKLLPPGFASLFDDSAASSLDVFFDPSSGSVDLQGLTLGMFGVLSRGLRKQGKGGTQRYLGDLEKSVKAAGSNLVFAVITEVSDSVLKGADANGFDGVVTGFRRGIVNVAMKPSVLRSAVVQGGATRRIKLDRIVGADEAYIEGYLQAMLDALFKQNYLRVKVIDDQFCVMLRSLVCEGYTKKSSTEYNSDGGDYELCKELPYRRGSSRRGDFSGCS